MKKRLFGILMGFIVLAVSVIPSFSAFANRDYINSVNISGITEPVMGEKIKTNATTKDENYTITTAYYTNDYYNKSKTFVCGIEYKLIVEIQANDGYFFVDESSLSVKINNYDGYVEYLSDDCSSLAVAYNFPAGEHVEKTNTTPATCENEGSTEVVCSVCGEVIANGVIPATGHNYEQVEETAATCVSEGVKAHYECGVCGKCCDSSEKECDIEDLKIEIDPENHIGSDKYGYDENGHYVICECGENLASEAHTFNDEGVCTVCSYVKEEAVTGSFVALTPLAIAISAVAVIAVVVAVILVVILVKKK